MALTTFNCPSCAAPIKELGTCPFCNAEIRQSEGLGTEPSPDALPEWALQARQEMKTGKKISAIKLTRAGTGIGLKEAKDFVELGGLDDDERIRLVAQGARVKGWTPQAATTSSCFPSTARILTPDGQRALGEVEPGDTVFSVDSAGQIVRATVTHKKSYAPSLITRIVLAGEVCDLRTTAHHSFMTETGWRRAGQLEPGDTLIQVDACGASLLLRIESITLEDLEPVFNLHTTGPHNFIVEGVLAHNFTELRWLRSWACRLFVDPFFCGLSVPSAAGTPLPD